ncbi:MAG: hypothetical protein U0441_05960 [Polyangiaceae bacterium]
MKRPLCATILVALVTLGAPRAALSQAKPGASQEAKAAAQALFDEAMALRKKGSTAEACAKLDESLRLDAAPGTKFYLAECLEQAGKLASAWTLYTEVADAMAASGQQKREAFARERITALAPRLSRLKVIVPDAARVPGLVVRRDGVLLGEAQWGFAVPLDPGQHTVEVTAPKRPPFSKTVDLRTPGATETIEIPAPSTQTEAAPPCATAPPPASATPSALPPPPRSPSLFSDPLARAGLVAGGVGILGLAAGGVLGALAIAKQNQSNRGPCDLARDVCNEEGLSLRADAITAAAGSTISFIAGGVMLAAGVGLVVWPALRPTAPTVALRPGGVTVEGRW